MSVDKDNNISQASEEDYSELVDRGLETIVIPENIGDYIEKGIRRAQEEKLVHPLKRLSHRIAAVPPLKKAAVLGTVAACLVLAFIIGTYAPVFLAAYKMENPILPPTTQADNQDRDQTDGQTHSPIPHGIAGCAVGQVNITALSEGTSGVAPDTQFLITTKEKTSAVQLKESLNVPTGEEFNVEQKDGDGSEFVLSFEQPLEEGSVYNIQYLSANNRPLSFAFQTQDIFSVVSTMPANNSFQVPVDSGIEITFNRELGLDIADCVNFTPALTGKWDKVGMTYIFIPDTLTEGTNYTVMLNNIKSKDGEVLRDSNYYISFQTTGDKIQAAYLDIYGDAAETFLPEDDAFVEVTSAPSLYDNTYNVSVYKISGEEYSALIPAVVRNETLKKPKDAVLLNSFDTPVEVINYKGEYSYNVHSYINLGTKFDEGYYYIQIKTKEEDTELTAVKLIQSSYLSVFVQSMASGLCAWVNDTRTGQSVPDATVSVGGISAVTDSKGIAQLNNPALDKQTPLSVTHSSAQTQYASIYTAQQQEKRFDQKYYTYVYTDRILYRPNDKVDIFGIIRPRPGQPALSEDDKLTISFEDILEQPLSLDEFGCFQTSIAISEYSGYGTFDIKLNGEQIMNAGANFSDYDKSMYVLDLTTDKKVYEPDEEIQLSLNATTYDGLPASGVSFKLDSTSQLLTTDSGGNASITVKVEDIKYSDSEHWYPNGLCLNVSTNGVEQKQQSAYTMAYVLNYDTMLESEIQSRGSVKLSFNKINRDALEKCLSVSMRYNNDDLRGEKTDSDFTVDIIREYSVKTKTGEHYDYIEKRLVDTYQIYRTTEVYKTFAASSSDGQAILENLPKTNYNSKDNESFSLLVTYKDSQDRNVKSYVYYGDRYYVYNTTTIKSYYIAQVDNTDLWENSKVRVGASAPLQIIDRNHQNESATSGNVMYFTHTDKIQCVYISDSPAFSVEFKEEYIPNVVLSGAFFDGKRVYELNNGYGYNIPFDNSQRKLDIKVDYDKDYYAPGEMVNAVITVADENGKAVPTSVNVSVVDEAALAATPYYKPSLYNNYYNNINYINRSDVYTSYTQHERGQNMCAECGGGDGEPEIRKNFEDNPTFMTVHTDENGKAAVSFKLSDSITTWRVTLHAVDGRDYIGDLTDNVTARLPFYINTVTNEDYIAGDDITAYVKSLGSEFMDGAQGDTEYKAEILKDGETVTSEQTTSSEPVNFNLGKLPEGEYILRLTGKYAEYSDGMELPFAVVDNAVRLNLSGSYKLDAEGVNTVPQLDVSSSPVRLTMVNSDIADIIDTLYSVSITSENRTDGMAAQRFRSFYMDALRNGVAMTDDAYASEMHANIAAAGWELIPELPYAGGEIMYTARFISTFPETIDTNRYTWIVENKLFENPGVPQNRVYSSAKEYVHGAAFLLAAATDRPLLSQLKQRAALLWDKDAEEYLNNTAQDYQQYLAVLFYTAALCEYGDDTAAMDFLSHFEPYDDEAANIQDKAEAKLREEYINTLELFIDTTINPPAALDYVKTKVKNTYVSDTCELVRFVREFYPTEGISSEVEYTLDGTKTTKTLTNFQSAGLVITSEQFKELSLTCVSGKITVYADYIGGASNLAEENNKITLERSISNVSDTKARISFTVSMPEGTKQDWYMITDRLPVNLRYSCNSENASAYYVQNTEKQYVKLYFKYIPGQPVELSYTARVVSGGEAVAESAFVSQSFGDNEIWGESERSVFKPR